jgi:asparagine synthase (glutamine-hydrolysing)
MCGIAGLFRAGRAVSPEDITAVERATAAQSHRGPDDSGFYRDSRVVLGHRRLSIIDLSPAGHQPMSNEDGTVWVTYNGEIYNYRELHEELKAREHCFRSNSDTEILIHGYEEWGMEGLLNRLRGMFAFALYDSRQECCFLARDRFGIKPLYYFQPAGKESLAFASEVKALTRSGLAPDERDPEGTIGFLLFGSIPAPATTTRNVRCLLPGHYLLAGRSGASVRKYWDLEAPPEGRHSSKETEQELRGLLEDSVQRHLVSDVPVGIFLSGGVDSVGLVALASRANSRLTTLTVVFDEQEFSEAAPARRAAEHFHTDHREVLVTSGDFMRELPNFFSAMDQPTNDGVNTYFVSRAARQAGLTVVLSGLGGDEVFWGYKHYRWLGNLSRLPSSLRKIALASAATCGWKFGGERWMRLSLLANRVSDRNLYMALRGFFAPEQISRLLEVSVSEIRLVAENLWAGLCRDTPPTVADSRVFNYLEMKRYMHDQLLRDTDVFGMASSIEARVPYLDHLVVERVAAIPPAARLAPGLNKPWLVNAIGHPLVREAAAASKKGFTFPLHRWIRQSTDQLEEMALQSKSMHRASVRRLWKSFREDRLHWSRAWALAVLGTGN